MTSWSIQPFEAVPRWDDGVEIRRENRPALGIIDATEARLRLACSPETLEYLVQHRGLKSIDRPANRRWFRMNELDSSVRFFRVLLDRCV